MFQIFELQFNIPTDKEIAEKARALILADLGRPYSLPVLAADCGATSYTLKRIFKKMCGISVAGFTLQVRIERAKELLVTTNSTLQMIAEAVGYTEGNNFQNVFKRVAGCTPREWRRKN